MSKIKFILILLSFTKFCIAAETMDVEEIVKGDTPPIGYIGDPELLAKIFAFNHINKKEKPEKVNVKMAFQNSKRTYRKIDIEQWTHLGDDRWRHSCGAEISGASNRLRHETRFCKNRKENS